MPKQVCDDGGSYGSQPQVTLTCVSSGTYNKTIDIEVVQSQGGGYGGGSSSAPRGKTRTGSGAKLRTGGASSDAVNFGK